MIILHIPVCVPSDRMFSVDVPVFRIPRLCPRPLTRTEEIFKTTNFDDKPKHILKILLVNLNF